MNSERQLLQTTSISLGPLVFEHTSLNTSKALLLQLANNMQRSSTLVGYINPHVFNLACQHHEVATFIKQCKLCCIDGIGVQIAALLIRRQKVTRIVAEELFNLMLVDDGFNANAVLIGVMHDEQAAATRAINQSSPSINIIDGIDGFQTDASYTSWLRNHKQIELVLIGAGTPRSEQIALIAQQSCDRALVWHIGAGTIKTWAGTKRRAPAWLSRCGLQWLHRIYFEPHTRHRYFSGALQFVKNLTHSSQSVGNGASQ